MKQGAIERHDVRSGEEGRRDARKKQPGFQITLDRNAIEPVHYAANLALFTRKEQRDATEGKRMTSSALWALFAYPCLLRCLNMFYPNW